MAGQRESNQKKKRSEGGNQKIFRIRILSRSSFLSCYFHRLVSLSFDYLPNNFSNFVDPQVNSIFYYHIPFSIKRCNNRKSYSRIFLLLLWFLKHYDLVSFLPKSEKDPFLGTILSIMIKSFIVSSFNLF